MVERRECPECGSFNTSKQMQDFRRDMVVEVRTCDEDDCVTEYEVRWGRPTVHVTHHGGEADA